jgi:hypothetical protein
VKPGHLLKVRDVSRQEGRALGQGNARYFEIHRANADALFRELLNDRGRSWIKCDQWDSTKHLEVTLQVAIGCDLFSSDRAFAI